MTIEELQELTLLLARHPEWRAEVRRLVLTDEILELPSAMQERAEAQARSEQRLGILEQRMIELAEAQIRTEQRLGVLEQRMIELVEVVARLEATLGIIADRQNQMRGDWLAQRYSDRGAGYFGRQLRRLRIVLPGRAIEQAIEDRLEAQLTDDELEEVFLLDVLAYGRLRHATDSPDSPADVWLAVEVSGVIDRGDVERADRRAALLRKAGLRALPVVAGEGVTQGATALLQDVPVVLVLDGRSEGWERALSRY